MQETYRAFVNDNAAAFAALFEHLLASDAPLVFHCTAGKDRTGFAAALILLALGVPRPVVMQDYLLTNELLRMDSAPAYGIPPEVMQVLWRVQAEFLDAALHAVDTDHGGVDAYPESPRAGAVVELANTGARAGAIFRADPGVHSGGAAGDAADPAGHGTLQVR